MDEIEGFRIVMHYKTHSEKKIDQSKLEIKKRIVRLVSSLVVDDADTEHEKTEGK